PKVEYARNPLGVDVAQPRLYWQVQSEQRGQRQTAWQVLVASSPETLAQDRGDLWDSGRRESDQTTHVRYEGAPLRSSQTVHWKVRAWDRTGEPTAWSAPATWTMGLLQAADWKGRWIAAPWTSEGLLLRHEFTVRPGLRRALLHVSGLGHYEASFNGVKVGGDLLSPGWTNYSRTTLYDTHEVTALLRAGENAVGLELGNGMYHVVRRHRFSKFVGSFGPLRAVAQLELTYEDGTTALVTTDGRWRVHRGPITFSSIYGGEDFDARLVPAGWKEPGYDDAAWEHAVEINRPSYETLRGMTAAAEPLRVIETRAPVAVRELRSGVQLIDFGQNASFMPRIRVSGPRGATVRLTPGEVVNEDGTIDRGTMGGGHRGSAWWQYTKGSDGEETWFPQFYYVGSRYLYVELMPPAFGAARPRLESVEMAIVHSIAEPSGEFATSNPRLNAIRDLVRWAQRSNMVSVLTDCPHREKLGWIEQYHLNGPSIRYEFDVARIFTKGMNDMAEAQTREGLVPNITPEYTEFNGAFRAADEWGAAFILVPWQQYLFSGDEDLLRRHYPAMQRYFAYLESRVGEDGLLADGLGDWYDLLLGKKGRAGLTPAPITATAFLFEDAQTLAKIADLLGRTEDAAAYREKAEAVKTRYNATFYKPAEGSYGTDSQASLALPLVMGLAPEQGRAAVLTNLVRDVEQRGYATAGDVGFRYLLQALAQGGRSDTIYRLIDQDEKPGYGYQIKQGATALTEAWDANRRASHNHFMLGQVIEWYYQDLAGITADPGAPGFKHVLLRPQIVDGLAWVEASHTSLHGKIRVRWERPADALVFSTQVPTNTSATIVLPAARGAAVRADGMDVAQAKDVVVLGRDEQQITMRVASGSYRFEVRSP
ncbi:MAG TPA: family 78 glycoside hydrolase catalytic domain, partial [Candidatus Synoicihabitans sp.]|nr:family 78 glycoside hydrolase catalytic domain [Candidatus Synoicihabitans sp.]